MAHQISRSRLGSGQGARLALQHRRRPRHGAEDRRAAVRPLVRLPRHRLGALRRDFGDQALTPQYQRHSYPFAVVVNSEGKRFIDEGADFRNYTYAKYGQAVLQQPGQVAWQIYDAKTKHLLRDEYRTRHVTKVSADTLEQLADKIEEVNKEQFLRTIREFNAAVQDDVPFNPNVKDGRSAPGLPVPRSNWACKIDTAPFEAYAVTCGVTFTFGGVKITNEGEVLNTGLERIPGLFAAGEMVGGIFYFNYPGASGLTSGAVFGRLAGTSAANYAKQQNADMRRAAKCLTEEASIRRAQYRARMLKRQNGIGPDSG